MDSPSLKDPISADERQLRDDERLRRQTDLGCAHYLVLRKLGRLEPGDKI